MALDSRPILSPGSEPSRLRRRRRTTVGLAALLDEIEELSDDDAHRMLVE